MSGDQHAVSRRKSGWLTFAICCAMTLALLFTAPDAMSQAAGQPNAAPENPFSRWFRPPSAEATPATTAPATAQPVQRIRKPRIANARKRTKPVAAIPQPALAEEKPVPQPEQPVAESGWPNAEANVGTGMITPLTVKTVREQLEPEPETVSENELSDIDRAAPPSQAAAVSPAPAATTDGSGAIENEADRAHVFAMGESMKAMMRSSWTEPVLLMLAGALAGLAASRLFV
jgi:hypothetical protein